MQPTAVIKSPEQLRALCRFRLFGKPKYDAIKIDKELVANNRSGLEKTINRLYKGPGYKNCVWCALFGATIGTLFTLFEFLFFNNYLIHPAIMVLGGTFIAGFAGKCTGMIRYHVRLKRTVQNILKRQNFKPVA